MEPGCPKPAPPLNGQVQFSHAGKELLCSGGACPYKATAHVSCSQGFSLQLDEDKKYTPRPVSYKHNLTCSTAAVWKGASGEGIRNITCVVGVA